MADLSYSVDINTISAQASLDRLQNTIKKTSDGFAAFGKALAGLAVVGFARGAYEMADGISEIGKASGLGTAAVIGFSNALQKSGGDSESAAVGLAKFGQALQGALEGNPVLVKRFENLGISMDELASKSDRDIFNKLIINLGEGSNGFAHMADVMDIFGKKFASVDMQSLANELKNSTDAARPLANVFDEAGDANDKFAEAFMTLQSALLIIIQPLTDMINNIKDFDSSLTEFIPKLERFGEIIMDFVKIAGVILFIAGLATGVSELGLVMAGGAEAGGALVGSLEVLGTSAKALGSNWKFVAVGFTAMLETLGNGFDWLKLVAHDAWNAITPDSMHLADTPLVELEAGAKAIEKKATLEKKAGEQALIDQAAIAAKQQKLRQTQADLAEKLAIKVNGAVDNEISALASKASAYAKNNEEQLKGYQTQIKSLGLSNEQKAVMEASAQAEKTFSSELESLQLRKIELTRQAGSIDKDAAAQAIAQLPLVESAIANVTSAYEKQLPAVTALASQAQQAMDAQIASENLRLYASSSTIASQNELLHVQDEMAKMTLPEIEKKYYDIDAAARDSAKAAIDAENQRRASLKLSALSKEEEQKYIEASIVGIGKLKQQTKETYDQSRSFSTGWKKAFNDYQTYASDAARQTEEIFGKAMSGMEDLIVNFAKTGKFEWRSFVSDMLEQLLRSQIQQVFAQMMGGMQTSMKGVTGGGNAGGAGLLGALGGLFGGGSSNKNNTNQGSGSGGLLGGLGSLLGGIGNIFGGGNSNNSFGVLASDRNTAPKSNGGFLNGIMSGIGNFFGGGSSNKSPSKSTGILSSIGNFFGGLFADGGNLGAGKWGIAGEAGPELIRGPASITPIRGGNITYNINAVDAMSFKQMIAQDPSFLHAVVQQGARSIPSRGR